jgi:hypothetical protein
VNFRLAHSSKGWTNGEIGLAWIKEDFDPQTKRLGIPGRARLLVVDGHNSHHTNAFLRYARDNNIHILCYPSHTTHVLQGLDVGCFGPLKIAWGKAREDWERNHGKVTKTNFLEVYALARAVAMTPENIKSSFRKTGVYPFDRTQITADQLKPALETSIEGYLPMSQPSPVRAIAAAFQAHEPATATDTEAGPDESNKGLDPRLFTPSKMGRLNSALQSTSAAFLVSNSPIQSTSRIPAPVFQSTSKVPCPDWTLAHDTTPTATKAAADAQIADLQRALCLAETTNTVKDTVIGENHAQMAVQYIYVNQVRGQLEYKERKAADGADRGRLVMDGKACYLTDENMIETAMRNEIEKDKVSVETARKKRKAAYGKEKTRLRKKGVADRKLERAYDMAEWEADFLTCQDSGFALPRQPPRKRKTDTPEPELPRDFDTEEEESGSEPGSDLMDVDE